ncbi:MAG: hypothetical protein K9H26_10700 [Prolixibacteraceae bacterium]|nr:hypothetical protein [Prolixibacteraceae bacterium]
MDLARFEENIDIITDRLDEFFESPYYRKGLREGYMPSPTIGTYIGLGLTIVVSGLFIRLINKLIQ